MKNLISFITLLVFLHATTYHMICTEAKNGLPDPVLDSDGDELLAGGTNWYFILPPIWPPGGLAAAQVKGFLQFAVVRQKSEIDPGIPLTFLPAGFKIGDVIHESTDMNIEFSFGPRIWPSAIWKVDYDESAKQNFVMLGGVEGNPGNETVSNWFKFEKVSFGAMHVYKIVFCPSVCELCTVVCSDVGIYEENGLSRLALSDDPVYVVFQKARSDHKKY